MYAAASSQLILAPVPAGNIYGIMYIESDAFGTARLSTGPGVAYTARTEVFRASQDVACNQRCRQQEIRAQITRSICKSCYFSGMASEVGAERAPVEVENFLNVFPEHKNIALPSSDCENNQKCFS